MSKNTIDPKPEPYRKLTEREEWDKAGCANNEEWHQHLKRLVEEEFTPDLADDDM